MLQANGKWSEVRPVAPMYTYALVSLSNVVATTCQYEALKYVSFPVQTLGKCAKMLPVLVWGIIILGKKHTAKVRARKLFCVIALTEYSPLWILLRSLLACVWDTTSAGISTEIDRSPVAAQWSFACG